MPHHEEQQQGAKQEKYQCESCGKTYEATEARKKELACCGQPLTKTEVITKSTPTPFGS